MFASLYTLPCRGWPLLPSTPWSHDWHSKFWGLHWGHCIPNNASKLDQDVILGLGLVCTNSWFRMPFSHGYLQFLRSFQITSSTRREHSSRYSYLQGKDLPRHHYRRLLDGVCAIHSPHVHQFLRHFQRIQSRFQLSNTGNPERWIVLRSYPSRLVGRLCRPLQLQHDGNIALHLCLLCRLAAFRPSQSWHHCIRSVDRIF